MITIFICRKCNRCQRTLSVRADSFFSGSRISLGRHVHFLWKWSQKDSLKIMETEGVASRKILVKFSRKCREVAWDALLRHPIPQLGGPGVTVQIDESKFNHKSKVSKRIKTGMEKIETDWKWQFWKTKMQFFFQSKRPYAWWRRTMLTARTCIVVVVVTNESNMASYFFEERNLNLLNESNADTLQTTILLSWAPEGRRNRGRRKEETWRRTAEKALDRVKVCSALYLLRVMVLS